MGIYLNWNNDSEQFQFPINPPSFEVTTAMGNTAVIVQEEGEFNLKGKRNLTGISWSAFFPNHDYDFCQCTPEDPYDFYVAKILELEQENATVHVVIDDTVNLYCTIESFNYGEADGSGDVSYTISFKEYRDTSNSSDLERTSKEIVKQKYIWQPGDTWKSVCKKILGDESYYKANKKDYNKKVIKQAMKEHPGMKKRDALVGYEVVIQR